MEARILGCNDVDAISRIVKRGGIVAIPTDTVYGLACDPSNREAVERLFHVKGRENKPVPVLCGDADVAGRLVSFGAIAYSLVRTYWPGALTIVAPMTEAAQRSIAPALHQKSGWLGVRVPDHEFVTSLAGRVGGCITGTSANLSGRSSSRSAQEVAKALGSTIDAIVDGGYTSGAESTVVKVVGGTVEVLRRGSVAIEKGTKRQESKQHR